MIASRLVTDVLWTFTLVLQAAVAAAIVRRKLIRTFPLFFAYTIAVLSLEILLLFLPYAGNLYALVYWYGEVITISLAVGAIFETVRHFFPPYPFLKVVLRILWTLGAVAALAAVLLLAIPQPGKRGDWALAMIMLGERSIRFAEACWLILVIALVLHLGRSWQQYSVGIVAGFGVHSALALALFELREHLHLLSDPIFVVLNSAAYCLAALIWAFYFLRPRQNLSSGRLPKANLSEWNNAVSEYYTQQWSRRY